MKDILAAGKKPMRCRGGAGCARNGGRGRRLCKAPEADERKLEVKSDAPIDGAIEAFAAAIKRRYLQFTG